MMMNKRHSFLFLAVTFLISVASAQTGKFSISGTIIDCMMKYPVKDVSIKLTGSDGSSVEVKSDSLGNYFFINCFKKNTEYTLQMPDVTKLGRSKEIKYGTCPYPYYEDPGHSADYTRYKFTCSDTLKKRTYDFCAPHIFVDYFFPTFFFKKNSSEPGTAEMGVIAHSDTCLDCLVGLLIANKSWRMEVAGFAAADEANKNVLEAARAKKLFDLLVSKGIDPKRLTCKSYSDKQPYIFKDENGKIIKKDQATINIKSRRASVMILSKDFNLPIAPTMKTKSNDDDGEN